MSSTLYNAIIYPLVSLMELILNFFHEYSGSYGISIILLSLGVNLLISPFYTLADKWQNEEQDLLRKMKDRIKDIKDVYKGDERHFYMKALYRLHGYSPFMSIRSSFGLLIQIPFFMAAYNFLSHYKALDGQSFLFFTDLVRPDSLLGSVNIMPFVMTGINLLSAVLFTEGQNLRSRIQLFGMAGLFLVLLYNSASGLLLYWTCNNLFSLVRILYKRSFLSSAVSKIPERAQHLGQKITLPPLGLVLLLCAGYGIILHLFLGNAYLLLPVGTAFERIAAKIVFSYLVLVGVLYFLGNVKDNFAYHLNIIGLIGLLAMMIHGLFTFSRSHDFVVYYGSVTVLLGLTVVLPLTYRFDSFLEQRGIMNNRESDSLLFKSIFSLSLMIGCILPLLIINDIPGEIVLPFEHYSRFLVWVVLYIVLIPLFLYRAFPFELKKVFAISFFILLLWGLIDFLFFAGDYGVINNRLQFTSEDEPSHLKQLVNLLVFLVTAGCVFWLAVKRYGFVNKLALLLSLSILLLSLFQVFQYNFYTVKKIDPFVKKNSELIPEIPLSKTRRNTIILMMDRALGGAVPSALKAYPELKQDLSGFIWYKNTISYGDYTIIGLPSLLGGYDYTPVGMHARQDMSIHHKAMEAWTVLPELFLNLGHSVYIADPDLHDLDPDYPGVQLADMDVTISYLEGKYSEYWLNEYHSWISSDMLMSRRGKSFFMFSLFRLAPVFLRNDIYDGGVWHSGSTDREVRKKTGNWNNFQITLQPWSTLAYLPELTFFQEQGAFDFIYNMTTHEPKAIDSSFQMSPSSIVVPEEDLEAYSTEITALHIYTNIAALKKLSEWFVWMKENDVYDNTQIIIVADHGRDQVINPMMPLEVQGKGKVPYNGFQPLLMFKPFGASSELSVDDSFMTNADVPSLVLSAFGSFVNPRTGTPLDQSAKAGEQLVGTGQHREDKHTGNDFLLYDQYYVSGNSLDPASWRKVPESEQIK
ncbi:MAG: hypothetical protein CR988_00980 [Treponema sp.]|nr:MAG: hypothetical protein CR988_00980 [Treponema sp.]